MNPIKTSTWSVRFTLPKSETAKRSWAVNLCASVVAPTAERALAVIREAHPDAEVFQVNHKGHDVTYLDPMDLAQVRWVSAGTKCDDSRRYPYTHLADAHGHCVFCAAIVEVAPVPVIRPVDEAMQDVIGGAPPVLLTPEQVASIASEDESTQDKREGDRGR